jgi:hypothetical protein
MMTTVIPEFAKRVSGTQSRRICVLFVAPGSRLYALARSGRDDK